MPFNHLICLPSSYCLPGFLADPARIEIDQSMARLAGLKRLLGVAPRAALLDVFAAIFRHYCVSPDAVTKKMALQGLCFFFRCARAWGRVAEMSSIDCPPTRAQSL